jgi:hypothetical protein
LCGSWELSNSNIELVEEVTLWELAQEGTRIASSALIL